MTKTEQKRIFRRLIKYLIVLILSFYAFYRIETNHVVIDGDTLIVGREKIRFNNIDAPEISQTCICNKKEVKCGLKAKDALFDFIGSRKVFCSSEDRDVYGRLIGECHINSDGKKTSLNSLMVRNGMAVVISKNDENLLLEESEAIRQKTGFWGCEKFEIPADFRKKHHPDFNF